jgi:hypothetical protein
MPKRFEFLCCLFGFKRSWHRLYAGRANLLRMSGQSFGLLQPPLLLRIARKPRRQLYPLDIIGVGGAPEDIIAIDFSDRLSNGIGIHLLPRGRR